MTKDKNSTKTSAPKKRKLTSRKKALKRARQMRNKEARQKAVMALKTGTAKAKIQKRISRGETSK